MTIGGFMSTGLSLSVIVDTTQGFLGGEGVSLGKSHEAKFKSNLEEVCTTDTESANFRMDSGSSTGDDFQIQILNENKYNSTKDGSPRPFDEIGEVSDCSVRVEESQETLNTDVLYTIRQDGDNWVEIR